MSLGLLLKPRLYTPTSLGHFLQSYQTEAEFRRIVHEVLPDEADEILKVEPVQPGQESSETRETRRIALFLERVGRHFPVADYFERYSDVVYEIPFVRMGWDYERLHEGPEETGEKLLFALCSQPLGEGYDTRLPVLDSLTHLVAHDLLAEIPDEGISPEVLHARLDDSRYAALALYADWLSGETGSIYLDSTDEMQFGDAEWSRENFELLSEDWEKADSILDRIASLQRWLLEDIVQNFGRLLSACLGNDPRLKYLTERRLYACEITEEGLVPNPVPSLDQRAVDRTGRQDDERAEERQV